MSRSRRVSAPWASVRARRGVLSAAIAAVAVVLASCTEEPPAELRIGLLAVDGDDYWTASGGPSVRGAMLAVREANDSGGVVIDGRRHEVRLVVGRYAPRADDAAKRARMLLNHDSVHALIGPQLSSHAVPVAAIAEAVGVPMISPMSTDPETTSRKRHVFRLGFLDAAQGDALARYALEALGARRAAVLYDESVPYSRTVSEHFHNAFEAGGGAVAATETYTSDAAETFVEQLGRIASADPEVLLLPNPAREDSIQMTEARRLGIDARFLGSDIWDLQRLRLLEVTHGAVVSHQWHHTARTPEVVRFLERFEAEYGTVPRTTAAMTYDALAVLLQAVDEARSLEGERVARALAALPPYRGVTGLIHFRGSPDPLRSVALSTVLDGEIELLELVDP